jgi:hypothetical protein
MFSITTPIYHTLIPIPQISICFSLNDNLTRTIKMSALWYGEVYGCMLLFENS